MKNTKGPWGVRSGREGREIVVNDDGFGWKGKRPIAKMLNAGPESTWEGNAHLIAAAPELLEACKLTYKRYYNYNTEHSNTKDGEVLRALKNAIAKAESKN